MKILKPENLGYGGFCKNFGQTVGGIIGYNLFIVFNSDRWCIEHLSMDKRLISPF